MHAVRSAIRGLTRVLLLGSLALVITRTVSAQDDFFKPVIEPSPTKKQQQRDSHIFSFGRFEPEFSLICLELEGDGRRERLVKIAEAGVAREKECITCRSFWKTIVSACGRLGRRLTPSRKINKKSKAPSSDDEALPPEEFAGSATTEGKELEAGSDEDTVPNETPVPTTPTKAPHQERYPSVALINVASRLSTTVYSLDSGEGQIAQTFHYFAKTVRETPDMSSAEREYYDIFLTYLLAAWEGRVDRTKVLPPTPSVELRQLFD